MDSGTLGKGRSASVMPQDNGHPPATDAPFSSPQHRWGRGLTRLEERLIRRLLAAMGQPRVGVSFWSGQTIAPAQMPIAWLHVGNRRAFWKILLDPLYQFAEAYASAELQVDGSLVDVLSEFNAALLRSGSAGGLPGRISLWLHRPRNCSIAAARDNIHHHYDLGNDFFKLWLDERLLYTCAYFETPDLTLEQAQVAKMDHVCRKAWLQRGERVIEAGCGWGALALHMARHYGVRVRAFNTSHEQIVYAREQARAQGLHDLVEFVEDDWRNISGKCDAFISVGMLEHVGRENFRLLGETARRTSASRGVIHSIGRNRPRPIDPWIERRIFPGAYPPSLAEMLEIFEPNELSVLDIENLRLHYAQTLEHWLARYEQSSETIRGMFDDRFVRTWRFYLAASRAAFLAASLQLFQIVFTRAQCNLVPRNRRHLYPPQDQPQDALLFESQEPSARG